MKKFLLPILGLTVMDFQLLAEANPNTTERAELSPEMKTYYGGYLVDIAGPKLIHDQAAVELPLPKGNGKSIEVHKFVPLPKSTSPLVEGITPDGQHIAVNAITVKCEQFGDYVTLSDMLELTAVDNMIVQTTKLTGNQAGISLDTVTREVLHGGTSVQYGEGDGATARYMLIGGKENGNDYLTVKAVKNAVRVLKNQNAPKLDDGCYLGIIHPDVSFDLTEDKDWKDVRTYCEPKDMYEGEIGKIHGVRFVETTEAKIFSAKNLTPNHRNLTVKSISGKDITVNETISTANVQQLKNRKILVNGNIYTITSATMAGVLTVAENVSGISAGDTIYPGEAGAEGRDVYSTIIVGADAYGTTKIEGGGLQHIVKQRGSGGTGDPLEQRSTVGWKATKAAIRLVEQYMVRIETASTFQSGAN